MYHIFLILLLSVAQNQAKGAKNYLVQEQQQKNVSSKQNSDDQKNFLSAGQQNILDGEDVDLIAQLKKERLAKQQNFEPNIDLESLGLDYMQNNQISNDTQVFVGTQTNELDLTKKESKSDGFITSQLPDLNSYKKDKQEEVPRVKNQEKTGVLDVVKEKIGKKVDVVVEKIDSLKTNSQVITVNNTISSDKELKVLTNNINDTGELKKIRKKKVKKSSNSSFFKEKIVEADYKEKTRLEKLQQLRKKYLVESYQEFEDLSKIIPKKKISPRFILEEVPPPLLNRFRSNDNKHHPIIVSDGEKIELIFKSIAENRFDNFNALFDVINKPNLRNSFGDTLLTFSVLMQRNQITSSLLSKGANPDLANKLGYTPLNIAIELGDYKSVVILLDAGAKIDYSDDLGRTYLMQSVKSGSLLIVDLLVDRGVDINKTDNNDITALWLAYKYNQDIIAKFLIKKGAISWFKKDYDAEEVSIIKELERRWDK